MTEEDYWQSIEDFCDMCEEVLQDNFVSFIVIGSIGADDLVPGWSDVDAFLIVKEKTPEILEKVKAIIDEITNEYPYYKVDRGSWFTVMVENKNFFLEPDIQNSWLNIWDAVHYGKVARGEDFLDEITLPPLDMTWPDKNTKWMLDFLKRDQDASSFWKIRNSIGFILCGARNVLLKKGIYMKKYPDIINEFQRHYPATGSIVAVAGKYRSSWLEFQYSEIDVDSFYNNAINFLEWCRTV